MEEKMKENKERVRGSERVGKEQKYNGERERGSIEEKQKEDKERE